MAALREIAEKTLERGHEIVKFIRDRTLIEDTESTIDLVRKGWRLFNQPERLAFSMTPPDFGSLLIQRRRWANGGLLIVPKLLAYLRQPAKISDRLKEGFMRLHYLISLGPVSMALLVALTVSFDHQVRAFLLLGTGLVYYTVYARDLHLTGYNWCDIFRVFALNLMLIPANLFGMMQSIAQGITGMKPRFGRTPKVRDRTRVPAGYVLAEFSLLAIWCELSISTLIKSGPLGAAFILVHAALLAYAIGAFIGYRNSASDLIAGLVHQGPLRRSCSREPPLARRFV
jgi:cellulose synthase/poly-beta-1,6-N-acetylglucosamine synthase-like glycosyltransferase